MKRIAKALIPALVLVSIGAYFGCQTLYTTPGAPQSGPVDGALLYYLPIGKITLTGQAPLPPTPTPIPSPTPTATATPTPTPRPEIDSLKKKEEPPPSDDGGGKPPAPNTFAGGEVTVSLTGEVEADEGAGVYYVSPHANYLFEDEVQISAKKHLLNTGKVTTEDKTVEIIGTIASIAAHVSGKGMFQIAGGQPTPPPPFTFSFHPHNACEVRRIAYQLQQRGIMMKVTAEGADVTGPCSPVHEVTERELARLKCLAQVTTKDGSPGLLFRPAISYKICLSYRQPKSGLKAISASQQFILPDPTRLYVMRYDRMPFVKKLREVGFTDGMLTDFHQKVPSPILGFLGIPKAIVQAIVPIPGAAATGSGSASGTTTPQ
jgi:hypothetical protein